MSENLTVWKTFWSGFKTFQRTGTTPEAAYPAMRRLFVVSNGWFNDVFHYLYCLNKPARSLPSKASILANDPGLICFEPREIERALQALNKDGYYVLSNRLDKSYLDRLMNFATTTPCVLQYDSANVRNSMAEDSMKPSGDEVLAVQAMGHAINTDIVFDADQLMATNYRFTEENVLNNEAVQNLMADPGFVDLAQRYFKSHAVFTTISAWWTTTFRCEKPSSSLAQLYHFDMDRIKFLKMFCYLTDVGPGDGPHCYVKGSCKRKPKALRRDGRFSDEEVESNYPAADLIEFTAPRGTVIIEDTRGFHKAKMPTTGNRLILEFELASCLFGPPYPKSSFEVKTPALQSALKQNPSIWSNFRIRAKASEKRNLALAGQSQN